MADVSSPAASAPAGAYTPPAGALDSPARALPDDGASGPIAPSEFAPGATGPVAHAPAAGGDALELPRDTTPTWEIELLVSGIVLVGLMQIPPWLRAQWLHLEPHSSVITQIIGGATMLITAAALYALIGCFLVHLALRGYWVALVGADSVFPHGVRWDKQREYGPIQSELTQARVRPLRSFVARADNAASLVFATGFVLAASALSGFAACAVFAAVTWTLMALLPPRVAVMAVGAAGVVVFGFIAGAGVIDMRYGDRIDGRGRLGRALRVLLRLSTGTLPDGVRSLAAVLTSNLDKRVAYGAMLVGLGGASMSAKVAVLDQTDALPGRSNYSYFAEDQGAGVVTAWYYESLWGSGTPNTRLPSIQSDVITEPYVRLFVPYVPARHTPALRRTCPGLRPLADDDAPDAAAAAVLACAARLHAVTLDGRPLTEGRFRFFTNPRTARRGFLMLVPVADLPPGEHVFTVRRAARDETAAPRPPDVIPFWK
jgi:hypothetical protein